MKIPLRKALWLAVGPANVDAAGHAVADWFDGHNCSGAADLIREHLQDQPVPDAVPHNRPDTSLRSELMAKLATQREVILDLCKRVDRLEMRADGLTPIERVERRWAKEAAGGDKLDRLIAQDKEAGGPAVPDDREPAAVRAVFNAGRRWGHQPAPPAEGEAGELVADELVRRLRTKAATEKSNRCHYSAILLTRAADILEQRHPEPGPELPADALAARPLLEKVARLGDVIGQQTVAQVHQLAEQAAAWLRDNPPGQPVAIEPRGCPTPGACTCVEPALPLPTGKEPTRLRNCPTHGQQSPWAWGCPECVRQLREELAALQQRHAEPVPVSERLPKPNVKVLAHYFNGLGKGRTICAIWVPAKSRSDDVGSDDDFTEYDEEDDKFYWPEGWYEQIENWEDLGWVKVYEGEVVYWQPLPEWPALPLPTTELQP